MPRPSRGPASDRGRSGQARDPRAVRPGVAQHPGRAGQGKCRPRGRAVRRPAPPGLRAGTAGPPHCRGGRRGPRARRHGRRRGPAARPRTGPAGARSPRAIHAGQARRGRTLLPAGHQVPRRGLHRGEGDAVPASRGVLRPQPVGRRRHHPGLPAGGPR
ncbi:MAG: hypothetical protein MZV64_52860 [Ignavibacteriales bacterium]|nr:hypothetical protein [Ignavibacteriales bacterium]